MKAMILNEISSFQDNKTPLEMARQMNPRN